MMSGCVFVSRSNVEPSAFIPYPPIEKLGTIGDRRTAALIAADGTLCWMCVPHYDGTPAFGALLDAERGGYWKLGPGKRRFGRQTYVEDTACLRTLWEDETASLELVDCMPWPQDARPHALQNQHAVIRHLRCVRGRVTCRCAMRVCDGFGEGCDGPDAVSDHCIAFRGRRDSVLWSSVKLHVDKDCVDTTFELHEGEGVWCVYGSARSPWTADRAAQTLDETAAYWRNWLGAVAFSGARRTLVRRSALLAHLLSFAPTGAVVAAPSAALPERIAGDRNYDYRFTWIRDASLSLALLSKLGATKDAQRFLHWISGLAPGRTMPLQVLYRIDGSVEAPLTEHGELSGYRGSKPVRFGNPAVSMFEIGSFGYFTDCAWIYLQHGGQWLSEYWDTIRRVADFTAVHWREPDSGIWEITPVHHFVSSKVLSWVALDRALKIARRVGKSGEFESRWRNEMSNIHAEVMARGWSEPLQAFRQRYDAESVDAALLLIPIMGFLPLDHPRVLSTVERVLERLEINGFLYRFVEKDLPGQGTLPPGEEEGAFLMCTFWLAQFFAQRGKLDTADRILARAESIAGELGLFSEAIDARNGSFLGNTPLLFSQTEYARAAITLAEAS
jgi:GH15 family glucan-1,4-alpha-glucosidase